MTVVGQATVEVQPNATGFGPKTEAAIKKALAGVNAKIDLTIEESGLRTKLASAVRAASVGLEAEIGTNFDAAPIKGAVRKAVAEAVEAAAPDDKTRLDLFEVDIDTDALEFKMASAADRVRAALSGVGDLDIEVDMSVDDDNLRSEVAAAAAKASVGQEIEVPVEIKSGGGGGGDADRVGAAAGGIFGRAVLRSAGRVLAAGGLAQLFTAATAGAVALAGGLISATSAAGSLVATVAVLPGLLAAAAQAAGTISLAVGGIKGAFSAYSAAQKAIGKQSAGGGGGGGGDGGAAARAAEKAIRNATRGVEDAYREAAEAVEAATERIADAGRSLIRAQRDQQEAQEDLTRARVEAREEIEELRRSVERLSLTEAEARRRLAEARIKTALQAQRAEMDLTGATEDTIRALERQAAIEDRATFDPRQKAANDLRDAELDLQEATAKRVEAQTKLTEFERTGVEGTERVIDARERLADADERVADEERDLAKAHRDLVRAREDGARRIADAEEALADALASAAESAGAAAGGAAGAIDAFEAALARLSPAARRFVEFLIGLEPILRRVQATAAQGLFPGLEQAITTLLPLVDDLEPIIGRTAEALAGLAIEAANLMATSVFRGDLVTIGERNIDIIEGLGRAAVSGASSLRHIIVAAGPLTQHLVDLTQHFALLAEKALAVARANGSLDAFFGRVQGRLDRLIVTVVAFGTGLFRVFREATPAGDRYLDTLTKLAVRFEILTDRASRSGALRDFFEGTRPAVEAIAGLFGDIAVGLTRLGTANLGSFTVFVDQLRTELLPTLLRVLGAIDTNFLAALVSLATGFTELFGAVLAGNPTLTYLVQVLGDMAQGISDLLTKVPVLSPILQGLVTAMGGLAVIGAVAALKQFASSVFGVEKALMVMTGSADAAALAQTRVGAAAATAGAILSRAFLVAGVIYGVKAALDALEPTMEKFTASILRAKDPVAEFQKTVERLNDPRLQEFGRNLSTASEGAQKALRELATVSLATAQQWVDSQRAQGKETAIFQKILDDVIQSKAKHGIAEADVQKKIDAATRSLQQNNDALKAHTDAMRAATNQALSLSGAEIATEEAVDQLTDSLTRNGTTFDTNTAAGRENKRSLDALVGSIQREIEELARATAAGEADNGRKQRLLEHLDNLANSGYPGARDQAWRLRMELEALSAEYRGTVSLDTTRAVAAIDDLTVRLNYLNRVGISAQNNINRGTAGDPDFRAFGGRVLRNQAYIVGERRPELFIPDQDGVILPQVPDTAVPVPAMPGFDFAPATSAFDTAGVERLMDDLESILTDHLAAMQSLDDERRAAETQQPASTSTTIEQNFNEALVKIEATFGAGSSASDIIEAMRAIAKDEISVTLSQVLKDHAAGAGTRQ